MFSINEYENDIGGNEMESDIDATHQALNLFFQNKFDEARTKLNPKCKNMYHYHGLTSLSILEALMSFETDIFTKTINNAEKTLIATEILSTQQGYRYWSDEQLHACLIRAESIIFKTIANIMQSGTDIFAIAKACFNIRESYKIFERCQSMSSTHDWKSEMLKAEFERLGGSYLKLRVVAI